MWGWIVAAVIAVAAVGFYFWPSLSQAPAPAPQEQAAPETAAATSTLWRSDTDAKFTREIHDSGVIIDRYEGEASAGINGQWTVVENPAAETALAGKAGAYTGKTVIKVVWEGGTETTYFAVTTTEGTKMTITDLSGRGGVTTFTRI